VVTVDDDGRLALGAPGAALDWVAGQPIGLTIDSGLLRLSDTSGAFIEAEGVTALLDKRRRLQLPPGIRAQTGLLPGTPAMALATVDRGLAVLPVCKLVDGRRG